MTKAIQYCDSCNKYFETDETQCPVCGRELQEDAGPGEDEIVSMMSMIGLL